MKLLTNTAVGMKILYDRKMEIARLTKKNFFMTTHVKLKFCVVCYFSCRHGHSCELRRSDFHLAGLVQGFADLVFQASQAGWKYLSKLAV